VAVTYLHPETTPAGVVAPGLRIVTTQEVPGAGRTATISLTLGRASANAQASTEAVELPADTPVTATPESTYAAEPGDAGVAVAIAPPTASSPAFDLAPVFDSLSAAPMLPSPAADPAPASPNEASVPEADPTTLPQAAPVQLAVRPSGLNRIPAGSTFYPLLLAAGALALVGFRTIRTVGVTK
jgi:hypothetical protein